MNYRIQELIEKYDLVLIVDDSRPEEDLINQLSNYILLNEKSKRIIILGLSESKELMDLYYTYEFSDHIKLLIRSGQYGGLLNLFDTGILSKEEVFKAIIS